VKRRNYFLTVVFYERLRYNYLTMMNFHEHKLWQDSFVALMDIHEVLGSVERTGHEEIIEGLLDAAQNVSAKIADGLSRLDHRMGKNLINDSVGLVAVTRTQLAVAWGRGLVDDDTFRSIDTKYATLTNSLQSYK
jgi:four helix bundle protein